MFPPRAVIDLLYDLHTDLLVVHAHAQVTGNNRKLTQAYSLFLPRTCSYYLSGPQLVS